MDCPTLEVLLLASTGELPPPDLDTATAHLAACPTCRTRLARTDALVQAAVAIMDAHPWRIRWDRAVYLLRTGLTRNCARIRSAVARARTTRIRP
jgi:anti-sigma factor RsiW